MLYTFIICIRTLIRTSSNIINCRMKNQINSKINQENIMNQSRFLILTIASNYSRNSKKFNIKHLLSLLAKSAIGALRKRAQKLIKQDKMFLLDNNYYIWVCWQLSLDHEETTFLLK